MQLSLQERQKGTLPSQLLPNSRNPRQANEAQDPNHCNLIHVLRSGKQVDNQVSMPPDPAQTSTPSSPLHRHKTPKKPKLISQQNKCTNL